MAQPTSGPSASNRRRHPRVELYAQVQWKQGDEVLIVRVCNASAGGLLLEVKRPQVPPLLGKGAMLDLALFTEDDPLDDPIVIRAKLVRSEPATEDMIRLGVEIAEYGAGSRERFAEVLRQQSGK